MRQTTLGQSGIAVSDWSLGTMTYGNQTDEADAHRQMDMALDAGVTFWDCAEMYPVNPVRRETAGMSEAIIGSWTASRGRRSEVVLATKVAGPGQVRPGGYGNGGIREACEASLRRLRTDRIDLLQLHWPERGSHSFRQNWRYDPSGQDTTAVLAGMDDALGQLGDLVARGLVRAVGLSNETAWGVATWAARAAATGGPRMDALQNEASLLCRLWDTDVAEALHHEGATPLAYSPLAAGLLTGKYADGVPPGSRAAISQGLNGRITPRAMAAVDAYHALAADAGLDPVHMALAWHRTRPVPAVPILGATTSEQLARILAGVDAVVPPDLARRIDDAHRDHPMPF